MLVTQRQLAEGLDAYQQSLNIRQILAEEDKSNSGSQRDLLFSYSKVCNALNDARQFVNALDAYQRSLAIRQILTEQDKSNSCWQRDLSVSYNNVGEALVAKGKLPEAKKPNPVFGRGH